MANEFLDQFIRHNVYIQRLGASNGNEFSVYLKQADRVIRDVLSEAGEVSSQRLMNRIIKELRTQLSPIYSEYGVVLTSALEELAVSEAEWTQKALRLGVSAPIALPASAQVISAALARPMQFGNTAVILKDLIKGFTDSEVTKVQGVVRSGFFEGQTTSQIVQRIRGTKAANFNDGILATTQRSARLIAKTSTNHFATVAKDMTYQANEDVLDGVEWSATLDSRTSEICQIRDGQVYPVGSGPRPPAHVSCFLGDAVVSTCSPVSNVYKRAYKGIIVDITTKAGRSISVTPNHPILTGGGWKAAGLINSSDKLACVTDSVSIGKHYKDSVVAKFSELFSALEISSNSSFVSNRPSSPKDFHGDGADGKVSIVNVDRLSWDYAFKVFRKDSKNCGLVRREFIKVPFYCFGSLVPFFKSGFSSFAGLVRTAGQCRNFFRGRFIHPGLLLLGLVSQGSVNASKVSNYRGAGARKAEVLGDSISANSKIVSLANRFLFRICKVFDYAALDSNAVAKKNSSNWLVSNAEDLADLCYGDALNGPELDDVLNVSVREFNGHVYNLENENNWYVSNGIIAHNCRSTVIPKVKPEFSLFRGNETRASVGADGGGTSQAGNYYNWLRTQPAGFQNEVLGTTKGKLFRNAGLDSKEFRRLVSNNFDEPLTLAEIRLKEPEVFNRLSL